MRAAEARRIDEFERGQRDLLGMIDFAERLDAFVRHDRHRALRSMGQRRIGLDAGEPFEQRALAGALITDDANLHGSLLPLPRRGRVGVRVMVGRLALRPLHPGPSPARGKGQGE